MIIDFLKVGYLHTNCYFLIKNNNLLLIDPGDDFNKISDKIDRYNLIGIIITHHHYDHVGALNELLKKYNVKVYDINNLDEGINKINDFEFEVIYTKGHTNDSITLYFKDHNAMFTGDFLFKDTIGRTDLPTGNYNEMIDSIEKIKKYSNTAIYPGHGEFTTLEYEKINNNFFK